jgi:5-methyltetrahydrofolate--homocysteine methyltransferase
MPYTPAVPARPGIHHFPEISLEILRNYIDWTPFFLSWELRGKYPAILNDEIYGTEASRLFQDANNLIDFIIAGNRLSAKGICGIFPANSLPHDDVQVFAGEERNQIIHTLHFLRQQNSKASGQPNLCLSDFIAPSGIPDYIGAFVVTAGHGCQELCHEFEQNHDDYSSIMVKAIADRFAEAAAEWLHEKVRRELWGYAATEQLDNQSLIAEKYIGIRPAPGYPACPDHTEKATLFAMLDASSQIGVMLTESYAMYPAASVSGWYFAHPASRYFTLGRISKDQVTDYAKRKGMSVEQAEKWLAPSLNYSI